MSPSRTSTPQIRSAVLSVAEAITTRRSIRRYKAAPVPQADLNWILEHAGRAPSSSNVQPWRFAIVRDNALKARLRAAAYNQPQVEAAPVMIVAYSDMADTLATLDSVVHPGVSAEQRAQTLTRLNGMFAGMSEPQRQAFATSQTFIAVGYLSLAAQSLGYATSIMGGFVADEVKAVLGLPAHADVAALIALGVADEPGFEPHRHPLERIAHEVGAPDAPAAN